jgi:hypothetical protein
VFLGLQQPSPTTSVVENASSSSSTIWSMTTDNQHAPTDTRVVRLRGLPYSADSDAVRAFFTPIELAEVYFCRRDGECCRGGQVTKRLWQLTPQPTPWFPRPWITSLTSTPSALGQAGP